MRYNLNDVIIGFRLPGERERERERKGGGRREREREREITKSSSQVLKGVCKCSIHLWFKMFIITI